MKSIGRHAFLDCRNLNSVIIPNGVTTFGEGSFYGCMNLLTIDIPNSVTSIGNEAFRNCYGLSSIVIPNSVSTIGERAFYGCYHITSIIIPNTINIIKRETFSGCSGLESITIPPSVEYIYQEAFAACDNLKQVNVLPENPPFMYDNSFSNYNITLSVPDTSKDKYMTTSPWSNFTTFKTLTGEDVEKKKCAKPTISVENGKLSFSCETEDVEYHYAISNNSPASGVGNDIPFSQKYTITVYASKSGFENSDTATAEITATVGLNGDANGDGVVDAADIVKVTNIIMGE